jgi:hypothetical protein
MLPAVLLARMCVVSGAMLSVLRSAFSAVL